MKTKLSLTGLFMFLLFSGAMAQKNDKFNIYLDMEKNGKKVFIDTSFATHEEMESYLESMGFKPAGLPVPPELPELPELPDLPELPELPDLDKIMIETEHANLSEHEKAEIRLELEKAKTAMEKARKEMKVNKKEMDKARKEMKRVRIQFDDSSKTGQRYFYHYNDNQQERKHKVVIVEVDGEGEGIDSKFEYKIFKMPCDSVEFWKENKDIKEEGNIRVIRKISQDASPVVILENEVQPEIMIERSPSGNETKPINQDVAMTASTSASVPSPIESYKLETSDFRLYPNPTQGKIQITFKVEHSGSIQV